MSAATPISEPGRPAAADTEHSPEGRSVEDGVRAACAPSDAAISVASEAKRVPLREGLFEMPAAPDELPRLIGVRCPACGARFPSRRVICLQCAHRGCEPCALSPTGTVWTFTIVHQQPPGSVMQAPYAVAQVELDDGPIVAAAIVETPLDAVRVGLPVEMTLHTVRHDEDGNEVVAHAFRARQGAR
jgi:uncharacterized OB-fold protein